MYIKYTYIINVADLFLPIIPDIVREHLGTHLPDTQVIFHICKIRAL